MSLRTNNHQINAGRRSVGYCLARILLPILYCVAIPTVQAECLEILDSGLEVEESHANILTTRWYVEVINRCDAPYDGTLRVTVDVSGTRITHESVGFVVVQANETQTVDGRINLPIDTLEEVEETHYRITERKRPV